MKGQMQVERGLTPRSMPVRFVKRRRPGLPVRFQRRECSVNLLVGDFDETSTAAPGSPALTYRKTPRARPRSSLEEEGRHQGSGDESLRMAR
jgi:hypothetical protein